MLALASPTLTRALLKPTLKTIKRDNKKIMFSPAKIIKRVVPGGSPRRKETRIFSQTQDTPTGTAEKKKKSSSSSKTTVDEKEIVRERREGNLSIHVALEDDGGNRRVDREEL